MYNIIRVKSSRCEPLALPHHISAKLTSVRHLDRLSKWRPEVEEQHSPRCVMDAVESLRRVASLVIAFTLLNNSTRRK